MNSVSSLWLSPPIKAEDHKYWEIHDYVAFVDNVVPWTYSELCKEVRSLWTTPYHKEALSQMHTQRHTHEGCFSTPPVGQATTCKAVMACTPAWRSDAKQGLFEMLIMGRKGRARRRGASSLLRVFTSCFCLSLQTECSCGGKSAYSNNDKHWRFFSVKQINRTQCLPLLPLHQLSSLYEWYSFWTHFDCPSFISYVWHFAFTFVVEETFYNNTNTDCKSSHLRHQTLWLPHTVPAESSWILSMIMDYDCFTSDKILQLSCNPGYFMHGLAEILIII